MMVKMEGEDGMGGWQGMMMMAGEDGRGGWQVMMMMAGEDGRGGWQGVVARMLCRCGRCLVGHLPFVLHHSSMCWTPPLQLLQSP